MEKNYNKVIYILITLFIFNHIVNAHAGPIPDSGQIESFTDIFGEDADYSINPKSYSKLDASGNSISKSNSVWAMVKDNVTGLIWEKKTSDGSIHDKDNKYTWYQIEGIIQTFNSEAFGNYTDWRLPTISELASIVKLEQNHFYDSDYFPDTVPAFYWSSNKMGYSSIWAMNFDNGSADTSFMTSSNNIRLVRGGKNEVSNNLIVNNDGTITDINTGLMWQRDSKTNISWEYSLTYCETLTLADYNDWRLPNREEIRSIVDYSAIIPPAINQQIFPDTIPMPYWTSSWNDKANKLIWSIYMDVGKTGALSWTFPAYARAVRGGQILSNNSLTIISPQQGSIWNKGSILKIEWDTKGISGNVGIGISRKGGKEGTFTEIINQTENDGFYEWIISGDASVNCVIRIIPWNDPSKKTDMGLFSINDIDSGLILQLPFDGDLFDNSGRLNHGENHGTAFSKDRTNNIKHACLFNGTDSYIDISKLNNDINDLKSITYAFWIKPDSISNSSQTLVSLNGEYDKDPRINIKLNNQKIIYEVTQIDSILLSSENNGPVIPSDKWSFISITINDLITKIYLNGIEKTTITGNASPGHYQNDFSKILISSNEEPYSGLIDDFRIYNRRLSDAEINDLYNLKIFVLSSEYEFVPASSGSLSLTVYSNILRKTDNEINFRASTKSEWLNILEYSEYPEYPEINSKNVIIISYPENIGSIRSGIIKVEVPDNGIFIDVVIIQDYHEVAVSESGSLSLQTIINNAANGSVINLDDGNYEMGSIQLNDKKIEIRSKNGPKNCVIEGQFLIENNKSKLSGLTIINKNYDYAIKVKSTDSLIYNCIINDSVGSGIYFESGSSKIINTVISNNSFHGINSNSSSLTIVNSTISNNNKKGIFSQNSNINITNSIIWDNIEGSIQNDLNTSVNYSNIQGGYIGEGNINNNPMFVDSIFGNYDLLDDSPCIDTGKIVDDMPFADINNNPRPKPVGSNPDMGAYENINGKKAMYVSFPPDAQSFCPAPDAFITIMWDTSEEFQFYRFCVFENSIDSSNQIIQDWSKGSNISVSYNDLKENQTYFWSVEPFPAVSNASPITGKFNILSQETCLNYPDSQRLLSPSFLFGYMLTKKDIKYAEITGGNKYTRVQIKKSQSGYYKYFGIGFLNNSVLIRRVSLPDLKNIRPLEVDIRPYWIRIIVYDEFNGWSIWL